MTKYFHVGCGILMLSIVVPSYGEDHCENKTKYQCAKFKECTWTRSKQENSKKTVEQCSQNIKEATIEDKRAQRRKIKLD